MHIISGTVWGMSRLARTSELSREARRRLKWMDYYQQRGGNARLTCRHFDISPQTFYRWRGRYNPRDLGSLEDRSHRPRRLRQPTWSPELAGQCSSSGSNIPPVGERQAGSAAAAGGLAGVHLYGGAHPETPRGAGGAEGASQERGGHQQASPPSPLRRAQAQGLPRWPSPVI